MERYYQAATPPSLGGFPALRYSLTLDGNVLEEFFLTALKKFLVNARRPKNPSFKKKFKVPALCM